MQGRSLWAQADYSLPKSVSHSPLIFGKLYCRFFVMDMVAFMQGGIGQIVTVNINTIVEKNIP